jgi:polyhydroxyalkanoate synthesis regulator phasin
MSNILEKGIYLGLGILSMTKERAEEIIDDLVEKGKVSKDESAKAVRDLMDRVEKEKDTLEKKINHMVEETVKHMHLATQHDIEELNKKLDKVLKTQAHK